MPEIITLSEHLELNQDLELPKLAGYHTPSALTKQSFGLLRACTEIIDSTTFAGVHLVCHMSFN